MDMKEISQKIPKTLSQYEIYVSYLEKNKRFKAVVHDSSKDPDYATVKWEELTILLNNSKHGPTRSADSWRTLFTNWKHQVRYKARQAVSVAEHAIGGSGNSTITLTDIEKRALKAWRGKDKGLSEIHDEKPNRNEYMYQVAKPCPVESSMGPRSPSEAPKQSKQPKPKVFSDIEIPSSTENEPQQQCSSNMKHAPRRIHARRGHLYKRRLHSFRKEKPMSGSDQFMNAFIEVNRVKSEAWKDLAAGCNKIGDALKDLIDLQRESLKLERLRVQLQLMKSEVTIASTIESGAHNHEL